jgi:hypothetical protein
MCTDLLPKRGLFAAVHPSGVTEPGILILKLLSITYLAQTRYKAFREAVQVYVL